MKKLAIFVEGQTEQLFIERLLYDIAGDQKLTITMLRAGGPKKLRRYEMVAMKEVLAPEYQILLYNSAGDESVKSDILENRAKLEDHGYQLILGLRDVYPKSSAVINKLETDRIPLHGIAIRIVCAVREVEAWFLAEFTHFARIDSTLSSEAIAVTTGFDVRTGDVELIPWPSNTLAIIYKIAGLQYDKSQRSEERMLQALDFCALRSEVRSRVRSLNRFLNLLDQFFAL